MIKKWVVAAVSTAGCEGAVLSEGAGCVEIKVGDNSVWISDEEWPEVRQVMDEFFANMKETTE